MHLLPADRATQPTIDGHLVCTAIEALGQRGHVEDWAARFSLLSDPHRLAMLLCIRGAGQISVTDLALATGMNATAVSQALRLLRTAGAVTGERDGRVIRYRLADPTLDALLEIARPTSAEAEAKAEAEAES